METRNLGYVGVIVLQQLAITGLLCAILHLLNRLRRMDGIARARLRTNPAHFRPANRERSYLHFDGLFSEAETEREAPTRAGRAG